jgi:hypothetical protein
VYQAMAATFDRVRHRHLAQGEPLNDANPPCAPRPL